VGAKKPFDVVHLLTQITIREPGEFWKIKESAFVWGPTGGVEVLPRSFVNDRGWRFQLLNFLRDRYFHFRVNRKNQLSAIRKASSVFAFSRADYDFLRDTRGGCAGLKLQVDAACSNPVRETKVRSLRAGEILRLIWAGQVAERKNLEVLINALARSPGLRNGVQLTVVGDGPQKTIMEDRCRTEELDKVKFLGAVSFEEVKENMNQAHMLVHTSYREAGTHIIPEALSCGLPVMCHAIAGMGVSVDKNNGWTIPLENDSKSTDGIGNILESILESPEVLGEKSAGAIAYSVKNTWQSMAEKFLDAYSEAMSRDR
jgi:glycosyltransferase involved in cell wall biosynthesis